MADIKAVGTYDGTATTAANLNAGTTGGTWSDIATSAGTTTVNVFDNGLPGNSLLLGRFGNGTSTSTATLTLDNAQTLANATLSMDARRVFAGGAPAAMFIDLFDGTTHILRINYGSSQGEGRGTVNHFSAIGADVFLDNRTALSAEDTVWPANDDNAKVTLNLGATDFGVTTSVGGINATGLSYFAGATSQFNKIVFTAQDNKASWQVDNISVIPEPGTLGLIGAAEGGVLFIRRRFMI